MDELIASYALPYILGVFTPVVAHGIKKIIDTLIMDFYDKKKIIRQNKNEIREKIINLMSEYFVIERNVTKIPPSNYDISIIERDKNSLNKIEIEIEKIKMEDREIGACFVQLSRNLSFALDEIYELHSCLEHEQAACWAALANSKAEVKISIKKLEIMIDKRYPVLH